MNLSAVSERSRVLFVELFGLDPTSLSAEKSIVEDLGLDSIDLIDLLTKINEEFNLDLDPSDFEGCALLGEFLDRLDIKSLERKKKSSSNA